jgi:SAM-dependent methyltransferase
MEGQVHKLKRTAKRFISAFGRLAVVSAILDRPTVYRLLQKVPGAHVFYGWNRIHPFDRYYGTDTSGSAPAEALPADEHLRAQAFPYGGSQPSIVRRALEALPSVDWCTFLDLGCGKGRPLFVASEFPFRDICGVELSPRLAEIARRNAAIIARRYPQRTAVRLAVGDASTFPLPAGDLVLFLYHPFGAELIANVVAGVEAAIAAEHRSVYIVYYNPVCGYCFDASPLLRRRFARVLPYAAEEFGYGPDKDDLVVIWQSAAAPAPPAPADARIVVAKSGARALLADSQGNARAP